MSQRCEEAYRTSVAGANSGEWSGAASAGVPGHFADNEFAMLESVVARGIRYGTIFADPPWFEQGAGKVKRGADRHYPIMKTAAIVAMGDDVQQLAKPNSHLYLWATNNHLPGALEVMEAWGFRYVTMVTWMKDGGPGLGQYFRGVTEQILFGVRGKPSYRLTRSGKRAQGLTGFTAPRGRHSEKPALPYQWAWKVSRGPYLELFGIGERPGWTVWGNGVWKK